MRPYEPRQHDSGNWFVYAVQEQGRVTELMSKRAAGICAESLNRASQLSSLNGRQRGTIDRIEGRYWGGPIPLILTRIIRTDSGQIRLAYAIRPDMPEYTLTLLEDGETSYAGRLDYIASYATLYEWPSGGAQ